MGIQYCNYNRCHFFCTKLLEGNLLKKQLYLPLLSFNSIIMKNVKILVLCLYISIAFTACDKLLGKEIASMSINQVSTEGNLVIKEVSLDLIKDDEIIFWSEMDMEYEGNVNMQFKVQVLKDSAEIGFIEFDPREKNVSIGEVKTELLNKTSWSFSGKNTSMKVPDTGKYTFKALLAASDNPSLKIKKAEIVLKK